jgi:hypothetical protein
VTKDDEDILVFCALMVLMIIAGVVGVLMQHHLDVLARVG